MEFNNSNEAFEALYHKILSEGKVFKNTKALYNVSFSIINPLDNLITCEWRRWKKEYADTEWDWYLSGNRDASEIAKKAKIWYNMMDENNQVNSNYGYWWKRNDQLNYVIKLLKEDKYTRRAIISHYNLENFESYSKDTPCNVVVNFYYDDDKLNMTVFARSIDCVLGMPTDIYAFTKLLEMVSKELNFDIGTYHYFITNLHIYDRHFDLKERNSKQIAA